MSNQRETGDGSSPQDKYDNGQVESNSPAYPSEIGNLTGQHGENGQSQAQAPSIPTSPLLKSEAVHQAFEDSVTELSGALSKRRRPRRFSEDAVEELAIQQANFLEDMGLEAINLARRNQSDVVSAADVKTAEATLRSRSPSFPGRLLEPMGGLLAGAGLAQLYTVLSAPKNAPPSTLAYAIAAFSTIAGIALLSFGLGRR